MVEGMPVEAARFMRFGGPIHGIAVLSGFIAS
jgi:hypothetical protein